MASGTKRSDGIERPEPEVPGMTCVGWAVPTSGRGRAIPFYVFDEDAATLAAAAEADRQRRPAPRASS